MAVRADGRGAGPRGTRRAAQRMAAARPRRPLLLSLCPFSRASESRQTLSTYKSGALPSTHSLFSFSPPATGSRDMLAFFKPAAPKQPRSSVAGEEQDDAPTESAPDAPAPSASDPTQPTDEPEVRVSSTSLPTIDSAPTIHGPQSDAPPVQSLSIPLPESPNPAASLAPLSLANDQGSAPSVHTQSSVQSDRPMQSQSQSALPYSPPSANSTGRDPRRFSFPSFAFLRSDAKQNKTRTIPPPLQTQTTFTASKATEKKFKAGRVLSILILGSTASSEKRAKESAVIVRSVIIGDHNTPRDLGSNKPKPVSKFDIARVKSQLLDPKIAAKVITQLRALPAHANDAATTTNVPIHAVCLDMPDKDVQQQHFAQLQSVASASLSAVSTALAGVHLVDLVTAPNMGFGAPVTAQGLFAGSVPTAETVIEGIEQITPQLMALGYATGKAILPDHKGVIVPTDRISVITCQIHYSLFPLTRSCLCFQSQIGGVSKFVFLLQPSPTWKQPSPPVLRFSTC